MKAPKILDLGHVWEVTVLGFGYRDAWKQAELAVPGSHAFRGQLVDESPEPETFPSLWTVLVVAGGSS